MIHLGKSSAVKRLLHSPILAQLGHSLDSNETKNKNFTSSNALTSEKNDPASVSGGQDISLVNESTLPEEPTTCCMSGCANCVWIEYADQVCKTFNSGEKGREIVLSKVTDPNMKAFLLMELKALENKNADRNS